jgi:hypothetical protein
MGRSIISSAGVACTIASTGFDQPAYISKRRSLAAIVSRDIISCPVALP